MTEPLLDSPRDPISGIEWWKLTITPNTKKLPFGGEKRLSAWLWFELEVGDTFTMQDVRSALGSDKDVPEKAEQLNRRLRELRKDGWIIDSYKDDKTGDLPPNTYRLKMKGTKVWLGIRNPRAAVSAKDRRLVIERDGRRCVICGVGSGEEYPGEPSSRARMTVGHRVPQERGGSNEPDNLQTECARCNEATRDLVANPESYYEVMAVVDELPKADMKQLLGWLQHRQRTRSKLDQVHDRARKLSARDQAKVIERLTEKLGLTG